ncbi:MAG: hypothetical protein ACM3VT_09700, partial [Solirubrobacterales bacterium]
VFEGLLPGSYTLTEVVPSGWIATTPTTQDIDIYCTTPGTSVSQPFGDVCVGCNGGGHTLGFWSNKNGEKTISNQGLTLPSGVKEDGTVFTPGSYSQFRTWILSANATNMACMLSAQLAAMKLNVAAGFVSGSALVYAPQVPGNTKGFISIDSLISQAVAALAKDSYTPSGDSNRQAQEILKNALDDANNNKNFLCLTPCPVAY